MPSISANLVDILNRRIFTARVDFEECKIISIIEIEVASQVSHSNMDSC